jgi:long-chain fatty acid transport protein
MFSTQIRKNAVTLKAVALLSLMVGMSTAWAEGFRTPPPGSVPMARGGGNFVLTDDLTAIERNPANLVGLESSAAMLHLNFNYLDREFIPAIGAPKVESEDPWAILPALYSAVPLDEEGNSVLGVAVNIPFGRAVEYEKDAVFRLSTPYFAELVVVNVNPTYARKINDRVSVGVGVDIYPSTFKNKQVFPWALTPFGTPASPEGVARFDSDGVGVGGNVGLTVKLTERQKVAFIYKSQFDVDYDGDFEVSNVPAGAGAAGVTPKSDFDAEIQYPNILGVGYGVDVSDTFSVGVDVEWIEHSRLEEIPIDVSNNNLLLPVTSIPQDWDDTWTAAIGFDWNINGEWILHGGYTFLEAPTPTSTMVPIGAEGDLNALGIGVSLVKETYTIDLAYSYLIVDDVEVSGMANPTLNGVYEIDVQNVSVAFTKPF